MYTIVCVLAKLCFASTQTQFVWGINPFTPWFSLMFWDNRLHHVKAQQLSVLFLRSIALYWNSGRQSDVSTPTEGYDEANGLAKSNASATTKP